MSGNQTTASRLALSLQQVKPSVCTRRLYTHSDIISTTLWSRTGLSPGARVEVKRGGQSELFGIHPTATRWRHNQTHYKDQLSLQIWATWSWIGMDWTEGPEVLHIWSQLWSISEFSLIPCYKIVAHLFFALLSQTVRQSLLRPTHSATHSCFFAAAVTHSVAHHVCDLWFCHMVSE